MAVFVLFVHRLTDHEPALGESYIKVLEKTGHSDVLTNGGFREIISPFSVASSRRALYVVCGYACLARVCWKIPVNFE
jgi:hypothetical protein